MNANEAGDIKITGSGRTSGGVYNNVTISGSGDIAGDVECVNFTINGSGHVSGLLKAKRATISGSARIDGGVQCEDEFKISGTSRVGSDVKCASLHVSGDSHLFGNLTAEQIHIMGSSKISGDCNAEQFNAEGGFEIGGLLNAGVIELHLHPWGSRAKEIGGEKITVTHSIYGWISKFFNPHGRFLLETGTIEGDEISLEGTKAEVVRGANVKIGADCEIGLVEYTGTFEQTDGAFVKENHKI